MERLHYRFSDADLCRDALTHSSFANERPKQAPTDNERLEFLGDAVVGVVVSKLLWERFPNANEGEMTRRRADLVCEAGLASLAVELGLGEAMRLGRGEDLSGGREKARLLSSAFEALMGAVLVDGGEAQVMRVGRLLFEERVLQSSAGTKDHKSRLQELTQARGGAAPTYAVVGIDGPDHDRVYRVEVRTSDSRVAGGQGRSKLEAEQGAAESLLNELRGAESGQESA